MEKRPFSQEKTIVPQEFHDKSSRLANLAISWPVGEFLPTEPIEVNKLTANSFDELYRNRHAIQRYLVALAKSDETESIYQTVNQERRKDPAFDMRMYIHQEIMNYENIGFVINEFPYELPPDTTHLNLWVTDETEKDFVQMLSFLDDQLENLGLTHEDVIVYKNPEFRKSIPEVSHYHIFARIPPEEARQLLAS